MRVRNNPPGCETGGYSHLTASCNSQALEKVFSVLWFNCADEIADSRVVSKILSILPRNPDDELVDSRIMSPKPGTLKNNLQKHFNFASGHPDDLGQWRCWFSLQCLRKLKFYMSNADADRRENCTCGDTDCRKA